MAGLAAAGSARAMGAIVRGFDTRFVFHIKLNRITMNWAELDKVVFCPAANMISFVKSGK